MEAVTPIHIPVRYLAWATDLHLPLVDRDSLATFCETLASASASADAIAITGDISDGRYLKRDLSLIAETVQKPLFVLLGNHDRYYTSFAEVERVVQDVVAGHPLVHRLTGREVVALSTSTALVGVDGWADGRSGSGSASPLVLNGMVLIRDLAMLSRAAQWEKMAKLSRGFSETAKETLESAMSSFREVVFLTHVPPLLESTWHEGRISGPDLLPHFCNASLGEVIRDACRKHRATKLTVLCGHTHSEGIHSEDNLTVLTAGAVYGSPRIDRVIPIIG